MNEKKDYRLNAKKILQDEMKIMNKKKWEKNLNAWNLWTPGENYIEFAKDTETWK